MKKKDEYCKEDLRQPSNAKKVTPLQYILLTNINAIAM